MVRSFRNAAALALATLWYTPHLALQAQESLEGLEERAMRSAVEHVAPCVVRIETVGGLEQIGRNLAATGPTTGLIVSPEGYILSSAFNFVRKPSSILVVLPGGQREAAEIVARDHSKMLVLLKVKTDQPLAVPDVVARREMVVGQWTLAVGRTYAGDFPNMSVGILSAVNRIWGKAIQTDAKISPSNYGGPLIDIRGRVLGMLVPLSPQGQDEMAGTEWYDSGIGFAIPLADVLPRLEALKQGTDLYPGILGISLKDSDMYSVPATIAACPAKAPAREAGLRVGDTIIEIDGQEIERQSQLRHALGARYAGDTVQVVAVRGEDRQRITATIELAKELIPYDQPFLGLLPLRDPAGENTGVAIRYVYEGGPAAEAGLRAGDLLTGVGEEPVADADALRERISGFEPGDRVTIRYQRDATEQTAEVELARLTVDVPTTLPPAHAELEASDEAKPAVGIVDIRIPESANKCLAIVPADYDARTAYGLLVWLHAPGGFDQEQLVERWQERCAANDLILLAPQARDPKRWTATEAEFIRKTMDNIVTTYSVDSSRVVLHGFRAGGAMAYLTGLSNRDLARGIAPVEAALPRRVRKPATDPSQRLAVYSVSAEKSKLAEQIKAGEKRLSDLKFPVTSRSLAGKDRYLTGDELAELLRWIDTLDRI